MKRCLILSRAFSPPIVFHDYFYVYEYVPTSMHHVSLVPPGAGRGCHDPYNWGYRQLCGDMWEPGTEPGLSVRAANGLNH